MHHRRPVSLAITRSLPLAVLTRALLAMTLCTLLFAIAHAQSATATLSGRVEDQNGAIVLGAEIKIVNPSTAFTRQTTTNDAGAFTFPLLPPGKYSVTAQRDGFAPIRVENIVLNVNDQKALKIQLKAGDVNATVQVTSEAPLINESPVVATTIDRTFVANLPLNGRSFQSLILLTPGIVATPSNASTPGEFSVNGQRQNANYFTVDGVSANTGVDASGTNVPFSQQAGGAIPGTTALGTTASMVSVDALEEFKIQTSTYSAAYGRQPGAQVQLITRSGTNQFHGTVFDYVRNDIFDARNWFNTVPASKPELRQNQFGGTFSGPVILPRFGEGDKGYWSGRNKTFFFFSYEGQRLRLPQTLGATVPRVPSLRLRQAAAPSVQPFLNAFPLPTGPEITTTTGVLTGAAPFATSYSTPSSVDAYSIRIDHAISSKFSLFGRYSDTPSSSLRRLLSQLTGSVLTARTLTLGATQFVTQRLNNEFRFNYSGNRGRLNYSMDTFGGAVPLSLLQVTSGYSGPGVKVGDVSIRTQFATFPHLQVGDQVANYSRQLNIVDNVSWVKGSHELRFGIDWRRLNSTYGPVAFGQNLEFTREANIVSSKPNYMSFYDGKGARPIYDNYSAYAQDTWNPSPRLTLEFGMRWEINSAPHDANGLRPVVLAGINGVDVSNVSIAPPSVPFYKTFKTAFAPRVGVAYQLNPSSGRETVLRGGFGVYYDLGSGMASSLFGGYPFYGSKSLSPEQFPISPDLVQPPPFFPMPTEFSAPGIQSYFAFFALHPNLHLPYTLQWNVAVEQSLGKQQSVTVSYVASAARKLTTTEGLNQFDPSNPLTQTRPNPNIGDINYVTNGPTSDYRSLQARYQRRLSRGLQALVNYTWSHAVDEVSNDLFFGSGLDRGNADFDVRHNFSAAVTYDFPKLTGSGATSRFVKAITNGWSLDSIFFARTGMPIDLVPISNYLIVRRDGTSFNLRPDLVPGLPFWISDPTVPGGQRLNPAAFATPPRDPNPAIPEDVYYPLRQGTLKRNAVHTPGIYQLNMALRRQFNVGERLKLQLKAEAFNVLNHPLFSGYGNNISYTDLGVPNSTLSNNFGGLNKLYQTGGPRSMQFSLRLSF